MKDRAGLLMRVCVAAFILFSGLTAATPLSAADHGQIAVIPDTAGKILVSTGIACSAKYPYPLCIPKGGIAFYANHPDTYDILIFLTTKTTLPAYEKAGYPLQLAAKGLGLDSIPWSYKDFGSNGRLLHGMDLGSLSSLPDDPEGIFTGGIPISGLEIIGHEIGHHWMSYANVNHGDGTIDILRGHRTQSGEENTITHWSCWFNSDSVMYGGMLTDNKDGSFTDINGIRKYSQLDQYLMGLRKPEEVEPMYYVKNPYSMYGCPDWPQERGVAHNIEGDRVDFPIDDVIRANGERNPSTSPCHYKVGFVLVHSPATPPTEAELAKVERYRTALETWFAKATDGRGSLDTRLDGCGTGTETCPGKPSLQCGLASDGDADTADATDADQTPICPPASRRCVEDTLQECANDGLSWQPKEDCQTKKGHCENDHCVYPDSEGDTDLSEQETQADRDKDAGDFEPIDETTEDGDSAEAERDLDIPDTGKSGSGSGCAGAATLEGGWLVLLLVALAIRRQGSRRAYRR